MKRPASSGAGTVAWAALALTVLATAGAITSAGFVEADAARHLSYARYALHDPQNLLSIWARPLATALYAVAYAAGGLVGVRLSSLACALACGVIAWRLAIAQRYRRPELAAIFTLGQPLLFLYSFTEMTELPFAAVAAGAFLAYRRRNWGAMALLASLLPLGRPEGFGCLLLVAVGLIFHRRARWLPVLPLPAAAWSYLGWLYDGRAGVWWRWLLDHWPYASASDYPAGPLLHFVLELPMLVSPLVLPAMLIGCALSLRRWPLGRSHRSRCQWLIAVIPLSVLVVHSLLYWLGKMSSAGELRYLLIAAPFWGLLSARGWEWIWTRLHMRRVVKWAALAVVAPGLMNWVIPVVPYVMVPDWQSSQRLVQWYLASPLRRDYPRLLFSHPGVEYYLNAQADDPIRSTPCMKSTVAADKPGYLLMWDPDYSTKNSDPNLDVTAEDAINAGWRPISLPSRIGGSWKLFLSSRPNGTRTVGLRGRGPQPR